MGRVTPSCCSELLMWSVQEGSASHAAVVLSIMLALEGFSVAGADSNHLVSCDRHTHAFSNHFAFCNFRLTLFLSASINLGYGM